MTGMLRAGAAVPGAALAALLCCAELGAEPADLARRGWSGEGGQGWHEGCPRAWPEGWPAGWPGGWHVQLVAEAGERRDERNYLGQLAAAHNGFDCFDRRERPPWTRPFVSLAFTNPELPESPWGYASDFRALAVKPSGEWTFTVRASTEVNYVTVSWRGDPRVLNSAWLVDLETGAFIRTAPGGNYSFYGNGDRRLMFAIYQR